MTVDEQRMEALGEANRTRTWRAAVKAGLRDGSVDVVDLLRDPPCEAHTWRVAHLLRCVPKFGPLRVNQLLRRVAVHPDKVIGQLTERQIDALIAEIDTSAAARAVR